MSVSFRRAPLNEVVLGKTFEPLELKLPHYGRFWDLIQEEFPGVEHAAPVFSSSGEGVVDAASGVPLPRVWFLSEEGTRLLQLQSDRFYFNWRQTAEAEEYVRFEPIYKDYVKYEQIVSAFALAQLGAELRPKRYEMTYVNVFEQGVEWSEFADVGKVLRGMNFVHDTAHLKGVSQGIIRLEYAMQGCPGTLQVQLATGRNTTKDLPVLRLELGAFVRVADHPDLDETSWFKAAHDAIVNGFCELTTEHAQQTFWKRES